MTSCLGRTGIRYHGEIIWKHNIVGKHSSWQLRSFKAMLKTPIQNKLINIK